MDIAKLEKLSCLKIKDEDKEKIVNSLDGVFKMMSDLDKLDFIEPEKVTLETTLYRENESIKEVMISKSKIIDGIHQEDGLFLAPKVIKK